MTRDLGGSPGIVVLKDEAQHCYLDRYDNPEDEGVTDMRFEPNEIVILDFRIHRSAVRSGKTSIRS